MTIQISVTNRIFIRVLEMLGLYESYLNDLYNILDAFA
jgi:hypothetical protein